MEQEGNAMTILRWVYEWIILNLTIIQVGVIFGFVPIVTYWLITRRKE